jgi:nicotinate-nucleotide adenylyltransferase
MGSDSYQNLHNWKNYEQILKRYTIIIYQRPGYVVRENQFGNIVISDAPLLDISASFVRKNIQQGKSIEYLVADKVRLEIENNSYYKL